MLLSFAAITFSDSSCHLLQVSSWREQCCADAPLENAHGSHDCVRHSFVAQRRFAVDAETWRLVWNPIRDFSLESEATTLGGLVAVRYLVVVLFLLAAF